MNYQEQAHTPDASPATSGDYYPNRAARMAKASQDKRDQRQLAKDLRSLPKDGAVMPRNAQLYFNGVLLGTVENVQFTEISLVSEDQLLDKQCRIVRVDNTTLH